MSTQLILYPQNYNGVYSSTASPLLNQYVADKKFNQGFVQNNGTGTNTPSHTVMIARLPMGAWQGFYATAASFYGPTAAPTTSVGVGLTLTSGTTGAQGTVSGAYQLIYNLQNNVIYVLKIVITTGNSSGVLIVGNRHNNTWTASGNAYANLDGGYWDFVPTAGTHTFLFAAGSQNDVLVLDYRESNGNSIVISEVSIEEMVGQITPTTIYSDLSDGQVICDLYEDESIPLSLSVDDFKNVAEKPQSYSKDFHLPNTKRNNKIFGHIFEVSRTLDVFSFNPYLKTRAILKEDSYTLFEGFLQLIDIKDKEGEISYNVNLFSESVTLADTLKEKDFNRLSFEELNHQYTKTNIEDSWDGNLTLDSALPSGSYAGSGTTTDVLKYPLVDWTSGKHLDASGVVQFNTLQDAFRPFIQVKYLIDRIIADAGFTYISDFLNTTDFKKLYMDFNWGADSTETLNPVSSSFIFKGSDGPAIDATWNTLYADTIIPSIAGVPSPIGYWGTYDQTDKRFEETTIGTTYNIDFEIHFKRASGSPTILCRWVINGATQVGPSQSFALLSVVPTSFHYIWTGSFQVVLNAGDTLAAQAMSMTSTHTAYEVPPPPAAAPHPWATVTRASAYLDFDTRIKNLRGELNQWEFLKGIMTMFNLIVVKEEDTLRIEPYADIFITGSAVTPTQHNWTDKVDISDINLKPLELTRKVKFSYEDDEDDYALGIYKKAVNGYLYGTKNFDGSTAGVNQISILTGEEEIIATPFAPTVIKPIFDGYDNDFVTPVIYTGNDDGTEFEGFENAPRIMYDIQTVSLATGKYSIPYPSASPLFAGKTTFRQFGHLDEIPITTTTKDINFGECQLFPPLASAPINNLFQTYYSPYYFELYHPDTRIMSLKVNLTPADIQNFKFYDTVIIKNREYRVNKIEYKPKTLAKVEFILIS